MRCHSHCTVFTAPHQVSGRIDAAAISFAREAVQRSQNLCNMSRATCCQVISRNDGDHLVAFVEPRPGWTHKKKKAEKTEKPSGLAEVVLTMLNRLIEAVLEL